MFLVVVVDNPSEAAAWYRQHLDFETVASLGWYEHIKDGAGRELGFMAPDLDNQPELLRTKARAEGFAISFELEDLDSAWTEWGSAQEVVLRPVHEEWGQYHFIVRDSAGRLVDLIQAEEEAGQ
jgi:uncharacterized glyoxalase superfamily protein PhnB